MNAGLGMSEDIAVLIEQKENEFSSLCQLMEELKAEFIKETVSFASEWYKITTKEYVTKYPEVTLGMKEETIAQMKAEVNDLIRNTEKTAQAELDNSALWWHQRSRLHDSSFVLIDRFFISDPGDHELKRVISKSDR